MHVTHYEVILSVLAAIGTLIAMALGGLRWIYRQGASGERLISAVKANTDATAKLTAAYDRFAEKTQETLLDHERRIVRLEDRPPRRLPADPGPQHQRAVRRGVIRRPRPPRQEEQQHQAD